MDHPCSCKLASMTYTVLATPSYIRYSLIHSGLASTETVTKLTLDQVDLGRTAWAALMKTLSDNKSIMRLK